MHLYGSQSSYNNVHLSLWVFRSQEMGIVGLFTLRHYCGHFNLPL